MTPPDPDMYDVAQACLHVPNGGTVLENHPPSVFEGLAGEMTMGKASLYYFGGQMGVDAIALDGLWYWFHPDDYDGTDGFYRDLREQAGLDALPNRGER